MRYEIRFINYGYGTITTDSWDTIEETVKRYDEIKDTQIIGTIEVDEIRIFDNESEKFIKIETSI